MSSIGQTSLKAAGGNIIVTGSVPANAAAGTIIAADLQWNARIAAAPEIIIPISEYWLLTDLFVNTATEGGTAVAPQCEFRKDNDRLLDTSQFFTSVLVGSNQRPNGLHAGLGYEGGSHMTANLITSILNGAPVLPIKAIVPYEKTG